MEQEKQQVSIVEPEEHQILPVEREEYQQQNERIVFIINLVANLEYYHALQQQELEGDEIDSLGKRKVHSYHKDELYINKK